VPLAVCTGSQKARPNIQELAEYPLSSSNFSSCLAVIRLSLASDVLHRCCSGFLEAAQQGNMWGPVHQGFNTAKFRQTCDLAYGSGERSRCIRVLV
jgi:hypothetical protein